MNWRRARANWERKHVITFKVRGRLASARLPGGPRIYLLAPGRELRVPPEAAFRVVVALSVPTQVDGVRVHVDVHEVVDDLALDVVLHPVDKEAASHVHHLDEGQFPGRDNKRRASEKQTSKQTS